MSKPHVLMIGADRGVNGPDKAKYDVQLDNLRVSLRCAELAKSIGCKKFLWRERSPRDR